MTTSAASWSVRASHTPSEHSNNAHTSPAVTAAVLSGPLPPPLLRCEASCDEHVTCVHTCG
jgi:hypothetical protein